MKTSPHADLSGHTGEQLLMLRILYPRLRALIEQELDRRAGVRRLFAARRPTLNVRCAPARVA
jgi:hypothetical protein